MGKICKLNHIDDNFARLLKPMVLEAGQHFTIRDHGGTIGTGFKLFQSFATFWLPVFSGKVTDIKDNLTEEEKMLMQMNKEKRAKYLAKKAAATAWKNKNFRIQIYLDTFLVLSSWMLCFYLLPPLFHCVKIYLMWWIHLMPQFRANVMLWINFVINQCLCRNELFTRCVCVCRFREAII